MTDTPEHKRLDQHHRRQANWKNWGPYLSERAWGTVREDYSYNGEAWDYFPHDHARSRAYRWNEDGLGGICDRNQFICFAWAFWNGRDPILKERLFGLIPREGNHGEDVKECYFYLDNTPTHSYMRMLYKYPQRAFPYQQLIEENQMRSTHEPEFELIDTGIFSNHDYFDIFIEYAKADEEDLLIQLTVWNRGREKALLTSLPTIWFRNTWDWGYEKGPMGDVPAKPALKKGTSAFHSTIELNHPTLGTYTLYAEGSPSLVFTENTTNQERIFQRENSTPYVKDAFHRYVIEKQERAINPDHTGTKGAAIYEAFVEPQLPLQIRLRLSREKIDQPFKDFEALIALRQAEADAFYNSIHSPGLTSEQRLIQRQAFAGLLWSKQFYYYDVQQWLEGDSQSLMKLALRHLDRNKDWIHLVNFDIISMPDKWEYPWYASWDLAFHTIPFVMIDPDFAKRQLILMTREWYMHPNGQIPAYEWNFSDVNPPVLAWAAWRIYKIDGKQSGRLDRSFLEGVFHKMLLNFTWWVSQKDRMGNNVFEGGFLGLDNISIFDRSIPLKHGGRIDQSDGTAWMGFYCIIMMKISLELASDNAIYQDMATKFFEHFLRIASAMILPERKGYSLWDEEDGFFYDVLHLPNGQTKPLKIRSIVGLLPLFAVETLEPKLCEHLSIYHQRVEWFLSQRPDYTSTLACMDEPGIGKRQLLSVLTKERLLSTLRYMLDENEFLSPYGIRSLSKHHLQYPYSLTLEGDDYCIGYEPGDSTYRLWGGGNSNWRGPIWFPTNFLIIESLQKYHHYYGNSLKVEFPTGSGHYLNLGDVAAELSKRLISLFIKDDKGCRPIYGQAQPFSYDPNWKDLILFHEFFHGESGLGLGACHQTGWTSLIAKLLQQSAHP